MAARGFRCAPFGMLNVPLWDTAPFLLLGKHFADSANRRILRKNAESTSFVIWLLHFVRKTRQSRSFFIQSYGLSEAKTTKQFAKNKMDCHDSASQNLAMTENGKLDSAFHAKIAETNINSQNLVKKNQKFAESVLTSSLRVSEASVAIQNADSANLDSATRTGIFANTSSLRDSANAESWQSKSICHFERSEVSLLDSVNPSPKHFLKFISFSQKGCTPHPAPPTRQKAAAFSLLGGRASLNPLLAKNRHSHYCSFESDFLHHEAGEIKGASHDDFNVDCHDFATQNLAMTENSKLDSAIHAKNAESTHPLAPSAREGEQKAKTSAREGGFLDCHDFATQNLAMTMTGNSQNLPQKRRIQKSHLRK
ncbi:hypothetical protein [Helicobacter sp. 23-1045]